ncbi:hypothetical protein [Thiorhodococcus minor]|uniref:Uncharacterized protein n=1 Tax=Thiorhodococcus minor TaxID=57489 RepID=A0A6M0JWC5_9GAMM|nr:hypothetical protein [Thiorhodococcus minor]NEV61384.1 hypothetical protein [Thiorhodococcus minor]
MNVSEVSSVGRQSVSRGSTKCDERSTDNIPNLSEIGPGRLDCRSNGFPDNHLEKALHPFSAKGFKALSTRGALEWCFSTTRPGLQFDAHSPQRDAPIDKPLKTTLRESTLVGRRLALAGAPVVLLAR